MINLYNMDCMEALQAAPDNYWDLAIVDPPYGINMHNCYWDKKIPEENYFNQLIRTSKNYIIWGGNYFIQYLKPTKCFIVWDKTIHGNTFADCEMALTSFNTVARVFRKNIEVITREGKRIHPTQKPIALYTWLLSKYAKKGDKILDTHLGSGSSAIAAHKAGYDFWGYEIDKDYFKAASKRLKEAQRQLLLF